MINSVQISKFERYSEVKATINGKEIIWQFCGNYFSPRANNFKRYLEMKNFQIEKIPEIEKSLGAKKL